MVSRIFTVAFDGIDSHLVEVQCAITSGLPGFSIVGLADKSISEARDRIRGALAALSLAMPARKIMINLAPADMPKVGAHYDLPIALAILAELDLIPRTRCETVLALGELALDGRILPIMGALPAAFTAAEADKSLLCPAPSAAEAAWVGALEVQGGATLLEVLAHLRDGTPLPKVQVGSVGPAPNLPDMADLRGQEGAKRGLEIAAAGGHHLLMTGAPGSGKSMLAQRLRGLLPDLSPRQALETARAYSLAGLLQGGRVSLTPPFRDPHASTSLAALVGGGKSATPGEIALAHNGVLFLDELPEFQRPVLDSLRQPIETGQITLARGVHHQTHDCRFLLLAAANPCRCGHFGDAQRGCRHQQTCSKDYLGRISGPILDRFDLRLEMSPVTAADFAHPPQAEPSATIAARVAAARDRQAERHGGDLLNATLPHGQLEQIAAPDPEGRALLLRSMEKFRLSARGYHRVLRVARTIADLDHALQVRRPHIAEALSYRLGTAEYD